MRGVVVGLLLMLSACGGREACVVETRTLSSHGNCGPDGVVEITSTAECLLTAKGAESVGLPTGGECGTSGTAGGFTLASGGLDGGMAQTCVVTPMLGAPNSFTVRCENNCRAPDGGPCAASCTGTLQP